ncbi:MAG TPA: di-heme oxidoredictase family protein [Bryobacteraceae bacterium]
MSLRRGVLAFCAANAIFAAFGFRLQSQTAIGREVAIPRHLHDGEEFDIPIHQLIRYGQTLFRANFTSEEGAGRPLTKGTGAPLSDPNSPLIFPRNNNRISGPESNSCAGCHNQPVAGGFGDLATNVFVLGQRFDFATFNPADLIATRGGIDERGAAITLQSIANSRSTTDMFGSGYYEMLARQLTADLQQIRNSLQPGEHAQLHSKGISFGILRRRLDGTWDASGVDGLPPQSVASEDASHPPSLLILPFHQASAVVSLRQFTINAFNQHLGMQATERFGIDTDPDGDGVINELTRADITAITVFQAALPVPGRTIPQDPEIRRAAAEGERLFSAIGCARCHIPALPLDRQGWIYTEPNPYNPPGNLQPGEAPRLSVDLMKANLGHEHLTQRNGVVMIPLYTDFKLHDICRSADDPNREVLNQNAAAGSESFYEGNPKFLTRRLWAVGSKPNYFHHGQFTTIREAILNHFGEALPSQQKFRALSSYQQGSVIEFLRTLTAPNSN